MLLRRTPRHIVRTGPLNVVCLCGLVLGISAGPVHAISLPRTAIEIQVPVKSINDNRVEIDAGWRNQLAVGMILNLINPQDRDKVVGQIRLTVVEPYRSEGTFLEGSAPTGAAQLMGLQAITPYPLTLTALDGNIASFVLPRGNRTLRPGDVLTVVRAGSPIARMSFNSYRPVSATITHLKPGETVRSGDVAWAFNTQEVLPPVAGGPFGAEPLKTNPNTGGAPTTSVVETPPTLTPPNPVGPNPGGLNTGTGPGTPPRIAQNSSTPSAPGNANPQLSTPPATGPSTDVFTLKDQTAPMLPKPTISPERVQGRVAAVGRMLSRNGATGLIRMPSANVTGDGEARIAVFGDSKDPISFVNPGANQLGNTISYAATIGFLPGFELGATVGNRRQQADLTVNSKVQVVREKAKLPAIAIGVTEIKKLSANAPGAKALKPSVYAVASKSVLNNRVNVSAGALRQEGRGTKPFGGVEVGLTKHVAAVVEHDTRTVNYGLRGSILKNKVQVAAHHLNGRWTYALGYQTSIYSGRYAPPEVNLPRPGLQLSSSAAAQTVQTRLIDMGLENVAVRVLRPATANPAVANPATTALPGTDGISGTTAGSTTGNSLEVSYENRSFPHNEVDALANVLATAAMYAPGSVNNLSVIIKRSAIPIMRVWCPLGDYLSFMAGRLDAKSFSNSFQASYKVDNVGYQTTQVETETGIRAKTYGHADVFLRPGLRTQVATEFFIFGGGLSLQPELDLPVTRGVGVNARGDIPLLGPLRPTKTTLDRLAVNLSSRVGGSLFTRAFVGRFPGERDGVLAEALITPDDSPFRLRASIGHLDQKNSFTNNKSTYIGEARYYLPGPDLTARLSGGRYLDGDKGVTGGLMRRFGDSEVGVEVRSTDRGRVGLIRLGIPLGPSYLSGRPSTFRLRPPDYFDYSQRSVIKDTNFVDVANETGNELAVGGEATRSLLDRDRLNRPYLLRSLPQLRQIRPVDDLLKKSGAVTGAGQNTNSR